MTDMFDFHFLPESRVLEELAEQLETTLKCIAYADKHTDFGYIKDRQKYFKEITKNGKLFEVCFSDHSMMVKFAYLEFQEILDFYGNNPKMGFKQQSPEIIKEDAEEIIYNFLTLSPFLDEEIYSEIYQEYEDLMTK